MSGIEIHNLTKIYRGNTRALDGLDLAVAPGELLALVGPSGSGKTTLLRLLAGLDLPTSGQISFGGLTQTNVPPHRRRVGMVFQNLALYSHLRVRDNLTFGLRHASSPSTAPAPRAAANATEQVRQIADLLEITPLLDRYPAELSGGQQQRVALGRAIIQNPQVLLFDEPLSSVDGPLRRTLRSLIKDVHRQLGIPAIYVTHDTAEALALGDRVAVLCAGRLEQVSTPSEVFDRPASRFVAEFFAPQGLNDLSTAPPQPSAADAPPCVTLIRPEDVETSASSSTWGRVESLETWGAATYARLRLPAAEAAASQVLTLQLDPRQPRPKPGDSLHYRVPPDRLHHFHATTGRRLVQSA